MTQQLNQIRTLRAIALFEATKGAVVLAGLIGLIDLLHSDVQAAALSLIGRIYIPFEVNHFVSEPDLVNVGIVGINAAIVGYLVYALWLRHQKARHA